jgi:NADH dehydrogenase [ubiquinone] 1 alpha subcomplex assembly factor 6
MPSAEHTVIQLHPETKPTSSLTFYCANRQAFYAVRAFNVETAGIVESVRGNVLPGKMRVQWWRDVIHETYTDPGRLPTGYPVLACLADAVASHGLSRRWFDRSLDARERDLSVDQPPDMDELGKYCVEAHSSLILLRRRIWSPTTRAKRWVLPIF